VLKGGVRLVSVMVLEQCYWSVVGVLPRY
jgi:hypothetical protein